MNLGYPRPDPVGTDERRFWEFLEAGELRIQRCVECGVYRHPPRPLCAACGSRAVEWALAAGPGEVWAATVIHPPTLPAFAARTPYNAVVVRLEEGVFLVGNVVDAPSEEVPIGSPVEVVITPVEPDLWLPLFKLVDQPDA
jgi:uncharacterized OB-fold protein